MNSAVTTRTGKTVSHDKGTGIILIKFDPKIDMPVDLKRCGRFYSEGELFPNVPAFKDALNAFLLQHMQEYVGAPGFYRSHGPGNASSRVMGPWREDFAHFSGQYPPLGGLSVEIRSPDGFAVKPDGVMNVDSLTLRGHVHLPFIPCRDKKGYSYSLGIELPILDALLTGAPIDFDREESCLRPGLNWAGEIGYVKVKDPTISGMNQAMDAAAALRKFCREREPMLQDVASEVVAVYPVWHELQAIKGAYVSLEEACGKPVARGVEGAKAPPLNPVVEAIQAHMRKLLADADAKLKELHGRLQASPAMKLHEHATADRTFYDFRYPDNPQA